MRVRTSGSSRASSTSTPSPATAPPPALEALGRCHARFEFSLPDLRTWPLAWVSTIETRLHPEHEDYDPEGDW